MHAKGLKAPDELYRGFSMSLAIIWPANPRAVSVAEEGNPELHLQILRTQSAVYWDSMPRRREIERPLNGYICIEGAARYKCRVERVVNHGNLLQDEKEHQYVPPFRKQCLIGQWENGKPHLPSQTWIKISKMERLDPPIHISELTRANGKPLRAVVGGVVYIQDPNP